MTLAARELNPVKNISFFLKPCVQAAYHRLLRGAISSGLRPLTESSKRAVWRGVYPSFGHRFFWTTHGFFITNRSRYLFNTHIIFKHISVCTFFSSVACIQPYFKANACFVEYFTMDFDYSQCLDRSYNGMTMRYDAGCDAAHCGFFFVLGM